MIEQLAHQHVDRFDGQGTIDIMAEYAHWVPVGVMSHLLGVPPDDEARSSTG